MAKSCLKKSLIVLLFISSIGIKGNETRGPVINTNVGPIQGVRPTDGNYTMFMGIPYAEVDKQNPFGPSKRYPHFEQTFEAIYDSAICPQIEEFNNTIVGTLDCLQLNVYVPDSASSSNPLPVLIWIHGGGYTIGFANRYLYGPSYLVRHDVIFITLNYRLGPYGFLCLDTPEIPGNQGLKDQLLGLRWIKENIEFFGGDPNRITLFGQSAGSFSVHFHLLSPQEELFHQIIMHSGSAYTAEVIVDVDTTAPLKIAERLGFSTNDVNEAMSFLSEADTGDVIQAASETDVIFRSCLETNLNEETILTEYPFNQISEKIRNKSVLLGFTDDETIIMHAHRLPESFSSLNIIHEYFNDHFNFNGEQLLNIERLFNNFYLGGRGYSHEMMAEIANFHSDSKFIYPTDRCVNSFLNQGASKIYYFSFSYLGERNFVKRKNNITIGGAGHTDEIGYLFDMEFIPEEPNVEDQLMIDRMTTMWTNFVKYGDPTPQISSILPVKWEPITSVDSPRHYMNIDLELRMGTNPFHQRMSFWDLFYDTQKEFQIGYRERNFAFKFNANMLVIFITYLITMV